MPIHSGMEGNQYYYQYGNHGKKYYFTNASEQIEAYVKARNQGRAIHLKQD